MTVKRTVYTLTVWEDETGKIRYATNAKVNSQQEAQIVLHKLVESALAISRELTTDISKHYVTCQIDSHNMVKIKQLDAENFVAVDLNSDDYDWIASNEFPLKGADTLVCRNCEQPISMTDLSNHKKTCTKVSV